MLFTPKAAIFDMDGLLVDSEPHWREVEIEVMRTVGLELSEDDCKLTTGLPTDAVVEYWHTRHPWYHRTQAEVSQEIIEKAHARIRAHAQPMPGAVEIVDFFRSQNMPLAVASASPMDMIEMVLRRLGIIQHFELWHSATLEAHNKPAPDVYLGVAHRLGLLPSDCMAFEDSGNGLRSAYAAGCYTVAVPADYEYSNPKFDIAHLKIKSLLDYATAYLPT